MARHEPNRAFYLRCCRRFLALALLFCAVGIRLSVGAENRWVSLATEPRMPGDGYTLTEFHGKLWVLGGQSVGSGTPVPNRILVSQDGITWTEPSGSFSFLDRRNHVTVVYQDWIYVLGGESLQGQLLQDVWRSQDGVYWQLLTDHAPFGARKNFAAAEHQGTLWVGGGEGAGGTGFKDVWTWNGEFWSPAYADFPAPRKNHNMVSHEGELWVIGGQVQEESEWAETGDVWRGPHSGQWTVDKDQNWFNVNMQGLYSRPEGLWAFGVDNSQEHGVGSMLTTLRGSDGIWNQLNSLLSGYPQYVFSKVSPLENKFYRVNPTIYTPTNNIDVMQLFYKLTLTGEHGSVAFSPGDGSDASADGFYPPGTQGSIVPTPDAGYQFIGWSGDAQGSDNPHPLTLNRDMTVGALFEPTNPHITVTTEGDGHVSPSGVVDVPRGGDQTFTIKPQPGSRITDVLVDGASKGALDSYTFEKVTDHHTLHVVFGGCPDRTLNPNYIIMKTYSDAGATPVTRYVVPDGTGDEAQTQLDMGSGSFLISGNSKDGVGLVTRVAKPYVDDAHTTYTYQDMACDKLIVKANTYYDGSTDERPNAEGYAFSEVRYASEPNLRPEAYGLPGKATSADEAFGGHPNRIWHFGAATADDFLAATELNETSLDAHTSPDESVYHLTVARDANGHYSQTMADAFGNLIGQWGSPDASDDNQKIISHAEFDVLGRLSREVPPLGDAYASNQDQTLGGELRSETTPDGGTTQYRYDADGRLRYTKTALQNEFDATEPAVNHYQRFAYDALDRLIAVSDNRNSQSFDEPDAAPQGDSLPLKRLYYDAFPSSDLQSLGLSATTLQAIAAEIEVHSGQLVAAVAFGPSSRKTVDVFSHDAVGRLTAEYRFLPENVPAQKVAFTYDAEGKVTGETYFNGYDAAASQWTQAMGRLTAYDALQRPSSLKVDGQTRFAYAYQTNGALSQEKLYLPGQTTPTEAVGWTYTIQDWVKREATTESTPRFAASLDYTGLYNGNLASARYAYQLDAATRQEKASFYGYDGMDRLTDALTETGDVKATYSYDAQSRLYSKYEEGSSLGAYVYLPGKNQLDRIPGHVYKGQPNAYVYDPEGNLVLDRSKKMTIDYDALGQAVAFRLYADLPPQTLTWQDVRNNGLATGFQETQVEWTEMAYDAFGQRVLKLHHGSTDEAVAYVGEAAELTRTGTTGAWTLSALNHWTPLGLRGRREGNNEYLYLTDPMGSIRMGLNAQGQVVQAKDYTPYGMPLNLVGGGVGQARAGYTEKEQDGETGLTYFGARYLDAEIGGWLSLDQKKEFFNPYSFVGGNPTNYFDPNGQERFVVQVNAFIPWEQLFGYAGDSRGPGQSGTSRLSITATVETDPKMQPENPIVGKLNAGPGLTQNLRSGKTGKSNARFTTTTYRNDRNNGNNAVVRLTGSGKNPQTPQLLTPAIDFDVQVELAPGMAPRITGTFDGFPGLEVFVNGELKYSYIPQSKLEIIKLTGVNPVIIPNENFSAPSLNASSGSSTVGYGPVNVNGSTVNQGENFSGPTTNNLGQTTPSSPGGYNGPSAFPWESPFQD